MAARAGAPFGFEAATDRCSMASGSRGTHAAVSAASPQFSSITQSQESMKLSYDSPIELSMVGPLLLQQVRRIRSGPMVRFTRARWSAGPR